MRSSKSLSQKLIEPLGGIHAKTMLYCRFIKFVQSILQSDKNAAIYFLHKTINDKRTLTGKNANEVLKQANENDIFKVNVNKLKRKLIFSEFPENSMWKLNLIQELTNIRMGVLTVVPNNDETLSSKEIDDIMYYVTT